MNIKETLPSSIGQCCITSPLIYAKNKRTSVTHIKILQVSESDGL